MDVLSWRLRSHLLWFEGNSVMLGAPWGSQNTEGQVLFLARPSGNLTFNTLPHHHALKISNWWVIHFMDEIKAMLAHGCAFMAFTFTSIVVWRIKRDARVRRGWGMTETKFRSARKWKHGCWQEPSFRDELLAAELSLKIYSRSLVAASNLAKNLE